MLVQFLVKNVLSFKDEVILDMTAINAYKEHESNLIDIGLKEKFVKVAAIYGANASGKSNLNLAMFYFQRIVIESLNNVEKLQDKAIYKYYAPFSFDEEQENSEFQIIDIIGEFEYTYGFEYNNENIVAEWLYRKNLKTNRTKAIFERTIDYIEFGAAVRRECDKYKSQIPKETLALTFFSKLKFITTVFEDVYEGILDTLVMHSDFAGNIEIINDLLPSVIDHEKEKLIEFLSAIDTGIRDIIYDNSENDIVFFTYHVGKNGHIYPLPLFNESEGTIKSIVIFIYSRMAIINNKSMFIDELNIKLHPLLLKFIIDLFYEEGSKAQLIYTTHDTTLMDKKFFRRDQIWFVQKDEFGYSELAALSDFKVRSDASFEKDYLAGVYGGIPFLKDFAFKEENSNEKR